MNDMTTAIWLKKYLMGIRKAQFHEIRYGRTCSLINRCDNNISGHHLTKGTADYENELLAIYEYLERLTCQKADKTLTREDMDLGHVLSFEELGFGWTGYQFERRTGSALRYVEGISLKTQEKIWVPSVFAYYLDNRWDEWTTNFAGNSNGNALGSSREDAIERGILEFMERDKFIKYWYLNEGYLLRIPEKLLEGMSEKLTYFHENHYCVDFYKIENEPKLIHSVWCLIRSTNERNHLFSFSGFGADITLEGAVNKAFTEATTVFFYYMDKINCGIFSSVNRMEKINSTVSENIRYFFSYDSKEPLNKILGSPKEFKGEQWKEKVCESAVQAALNYYKDVFYVPIQSDILEELGLYEVKVVGLGGNNMYFHVSEEVKGQGKIPEYCPLD